MLFIFSPLPQHRLAWDYANAVWKKIPRVFLVQPQGCLRSVTWLMLDNEEICHFDDLLVELLRISD